MSNVLRLILLIALAIFVIGFVWALFSIVKNTRTAKKEETQQTTPPPTPTPQPTPQPAPQPAPSPTPIPESGANTTREAKAPAAQKTYEVVTYYITETIEPSPVTEAVAGSAWARAWTDSSGAHAEAYSQ